MSQLVILSGELLQTQFWDTDPATGPASHWTVHGLWPDHCDGTYSQYCDESRQYINSSAILKSYNANSLLSNIETYWKDDGGNDESFWEHEWGKHRNCISTFDPNCYVDYTPQEEVVDFFQKKPSAPSKRSIPTHSSLLRVSCLARRRITLVRRLSMR
ncbi:hypothetical protein ABVK25_006897 [Lepraria finkii]|uniref:Uncharacterized protein n=1 Tax=Lepraria finkii TaxID=1340010 RepID=A0ABR4B7E3_9LECA